MATLELKFACRVPRKEDKPGASKNYYITSTFFLFEGDRPGDDVIFRHAIGIARNAVRVPSLEHSWQLMPPKRRQKLYQQEKSEISRVAELHGIDVDIDAIMCAMEEMVDEALIAARRRCIAANYHESDDAWWPDRHGTMRREIGAPEAKVGYAA